MSRTGRWSPGAAALAAAGVGALLLAWPDPAGAQAPEPYRDPPFTCTVIDYGTEPPTLPAPPDDPLCVRYDKSNITVSTLGVIDFLAAEPGRVAIVAGKCSYWQQDHWIIRASPDTPPIVSWVGSYWYDSPTASAGGILRELRVADQPATGDAFIAAVRPLVGDEQADRLAAFTESEGGGGATMALPEGFGGDPCAGSASTGSTTTTAAASPATEGPTAGRGSSAEAGTGNRGGAGLPATGGASPVGIGLVLTAVFVVARRWVRAAR